MKKLLAIIGAFVTGGLAIIGLTAIESANAMLSQN